VTSIRWEHIHPKIVGIHLSSTILIDISEQLFSVTYEELTVSEQRELNRILRAQSSGAGAARSIDRVAGRGADLGVGARGAELRYAVRFPLARAVCRQADRAIVRPSRGPPKTVKRKYFALCPSRVLTCGLLTTIFGAMRFNLRQMSLGLISMVIGLTATVGLLEVVLRLLPVSDSIDRSKVNADQPYIHLPKNSVVTSTLGWNFYKQTSRRINNYGYASDIDYAKNSRPGLVIVGDSFMEAMQVQSQKTLPALLHAQLPRGAYNIAISGAPLSQYLAFAEFGFREFSPAALVFVIVGNDFDESLCHVRPQAGMFCFDFGQNRQLSLRLIPSEGDSVLRSLAKSSALARYLVFNGGVNWRRLAVRLAPGEVSDNRSYVGNVSAWATPGLITESKQGIDFFLDELPKRTADTPAIFLIDGMRPDIYDEEKLTQAQGSYFDLMRTYFIDTGRRMGYEVIDMQPIFQRSYNSDGRRMEFPTDAHWNELGHEIAAAAVMQSRTLGKFLQAYEEGKRR